MGAMPTYGRWCIAAVAAMQIYLCTLCCCSCDSDSLGAFFVLGFIAQLICAIGTIFHVGRMYPDNGCAVAVCHLDTSRSQFWELQNRTTSEVRDQWGRSTINAYAACGIMLLPLFAVITHSFLSRWSAAIFTAVRLGSHAAGRGARACWRRLRCEPATIAQVAVTAETAQLVMSLQSADLMEQSDPVVTLRFKTLGGDRFVLSYQVDAAVAEPEACRELPRRGPLRGPMTGGRRHVSLARPYHNFFPVAADLCRLFPGFDVTTKVATASNPDVFAGSARRGITLQQLLELSCQGRAEGGELVVVFANTPTRWGTAWSLLRLPWCQRRPTCELRELDASECWPEVYELASGLAAPYRHGGGRPAVMQLEPVAPPLDI